MAAHDNNQGADIKSFPTANKFSLLRRLSITSLAAMLITAATLVFLYRQDQFSEHEEIAAYENEKIAIHLTHLLSDQINTLIFSSEGRDAQTLRANQNIDAFSAVLEAAREHHVAKLKIFNLSGIAVFSSVKEEIGTTSRHPDLLAKALRGEAQHKLEFHNTILVRSGELHDRYIADTYMPLTHAKKLIGAIEIYKDSTQMFNRFKTNSIQIAIIVFSAFTVLYAALFFYVRRTDRIVSKWQKLTTESEARYRSLFDNMLEGFAYCKMQHDDHNRPVDFVYLNVNESFKRLMGLQNVTGKPVSEIIPGIREHNPGLFEIYDQVALTGVPQKFDLDLKPIGKWLSISVYSSEKGFFVTVFDDITERKQLEAAKQEALGRLQKIASQVPGVVFQFKLHPDGSTCIPYASDAIRKIYRLGPEEVRENASRIFTAVHPDDFDGHMDSIRASAQYLIPWLNEYRVKFEDGTERWLFGNALPQREADGSTIWHGFITDITERKRIEEKLRKMTESLEVKVVERRKQVRTLSAQLAMTEERERRMLAQDLHDNLGQLLAIIKIKLTSLAAGLSQYSVNQIVELVDKADQSARMITMQLSPPILHTLGFAAALEGLREEMDRTFGLAVHIYNESDLKPLAIGMQAVLYRSVRELLINTAKHAKVSDANLSCLCDSSQVTLVVGDDGCGFDTAGFPDTLPERPSFGLRSIYERITNIGGKMEIDSSPGNGATITLTVPCFIAEKRGRR